MKSSLADTSLILLSQFLSGQKQGAMVNTACMELTKLGGDKEDEDDSSFVNTIGLQRMKSAVIDAHSGNDGSREGYSCFRDSQSDACFDNY